MFGETAFQDSSKTYDMYEILVCQHYKQRSYTTSTLGHENIRDIQECHVLITGTYQDSGLWLDEKGKNGNILKYVYIEKNMFYYAAENTKTIFVI